MPNPTYSSRPVGPQKRFAEDQCKHNWILNVDADEVVSPRLAASIRALFEGDGPADVGRGPGDDHHLAGQSEVHDALPEALRRRTGGRRIAGR